MVQAIAKTFIFLGAGPRGDIWNIFTTGFIYLALALLSYRFYKRTSDYFFSFLSFGFLAFVIEKIILFFAISSMHVWRIFTPDQLEPWFPPMEHFFETVAIIILSFSFCYIAFLFKGKELRIDTSIFKPWENKDLEVKVINYIFIIALSTSFIGYLFISHYWMEFFNHTFRTTGQITTFGQFWADLLIEIIHLAFYLITAIYISYSIFPLKKGKNKHLIATLIVAAFSLNAIGHYAHIFNLANGEIYIAITDSIKRVFEFIASLLFFGVIYYRFSDRLDKKREKISKTLNEVREFTKAFYAISKGASQSKYLDFNLTMPKALSDEEFGKLSISVKSMIDSIKKREDSLQAGSQELQVLNEELSASYEELSKLYNEQENYVNELKKSQNELIAEKNKVDAIISSIGDGLSIQDTDYNIIYVNDFYIERFGRGIIGKKCYEVYEKEEAPCDGCPLRKAIETGEISRAVRAGFDMHNQKIYVDITASPVKNEEGEIIGGIELTKDITKRIQLENQLKNNIDELNKANEKLVKMDKVKSNFVGMASHELRTPLTMIKGYSELLMVERKDKLDKVSYEMVGNIHTSAERLNGIISDILDVSRIDENKLRLNKQKNDISTVINNAVNDLKHYANKRKHKIIIDGSNKIDTFYFDANRMYQVFSNLIGNAIKYTPDEGEIIISLSLVQKDELIHKITDESILRRLNETGAEWVELVTKDNGIGIDKTEHKRIFERFYEVCSINEHTSSKSDFLGGGAGLGLSVCKGIVEAHGGVIWAASKGSDEKKRHGSSFHILMPYLLENKETVPQNELPFMLYDV